MAAIITNKRTLRCLAMLALAWAYLPSTSSARLPERIVWYGVLEDGLQEALITGKPVMLTSAAPKCMEVPGNW